MTTPAQIKFLSSLASERGIVLDMGAIHAMTTRQATAEIDRIKALPRPRAARVAVAEDVPAPGYYAVEYQGVLRFYRVVAGKGKWEGRIFLNRFRSDLEDRVFPAERKVVYSAINADPAAAAKCFAVETVCCYRCGRRLTDAESRARGMGSECAGKA